MENTVKALDRSIDICDIPEMMTLKEYIKQRNLRQEDAAKEIGISRSYLSEIMSRAKSPGRNTIQKIALWSGNEVSPSVWFVSDVQQK